MTPTRREFVTSAAALPFASQLLGAQARVPVVDTHLHCFAGTKDPRFPYHKDAPYRPEDASTPEHLLECMDGAGVDFAVKASRYANEAREKSMAAAGTTDSGGRPQNP